MKIMVDADACPTIKIIEKIAKEKQIPLLLLCDTAHVLHSEYSDVITVDKGADAVDFMIIKKGEKGDIVVTQDYGVAAMALGKGMYAIHQSGKEYTNQNIDLMLFERHAAKEMRNSGKHKTHSKGAKKRTTADDMKFESELRKLIERKRAVL